MFVGTGAIAGQGARRTRVVTAVSTGWMLAGTTEDVAGSGDAAWTSPTNASGSPDDAYSTCNLQGYEVSHTLRAYNFDWTGIPTGKTITGIVLSVNGSYLYDNPSTYVRLYNSGSYIGTIAYIQSYLPYGIPPGAMDWCEIGRGWGMSTGSPNWGTTLTTTTFRDAADGFVLFTNGFLSTDQASSVYVDSMRMEVFYIP